jgi:hypothetical protein
VRALARIVRILLVALAAGIAPMPPPPTFLRHDDGVAQIEEDEAP